MGYILYYWGWNKQKKHIGTPTFKLPASTKNRSWLSPAEYHLCQFGYMITYNTSLVDVLKDHYYIKYFMAMKYGSFLSWVSTSNIKNWQKYYKHQIYKYI